MRKLYSFILLISIFLILVSASDLTIRTKGQEGLVNDYTFDDSSNDLPQEFDPALIGNWEYATTQFDVQFGFYKAGYCFYEDGTGLDVFWNEPFTYSAKNGILDLQYDNPDYSLEKIIYSIKHEDQFNGIVSSQGFDLLHFEYEGIDSYGDSFLHIPEDVFSQASIQEGTEESWNDYWIITTEDGENVTIESRSRYYGRDEDPRVIPSRINGHLVKRVNCAVIEPGLDFDKVSTIIVEEGIEEIGGKAFAAAQVRAVTLPASVKYIAEDAFYDSGMNNNAAGQLVLNVPPGSYAEQYAQEHNLSYTNSEGEGLLQQTAQSDLHPYDSSESSIDFYVQVNSMDGLVNFRTGPGTRESLINTIPNGQELHITDMQYNREDDLFFGYTLFQGVEGWISLRNTNILTGGNYPNPHFYVTVQSDAGSLNVRTEPGTVFPDLAEIKNGTQLHIIDMQYNAGDGLFFGYTNSNGLNGWVSLRQTSFVKGTESYESSEEEANDKALVFLPSDNDIDIWDAPSVSTNSNADFTIEGISKNMTPDAASAYLELLRASEPDIRIAEQVETMNGGTLFANIVFVNIVGDPVPEMVYETVAYEEGSLTPTFTGDLFYFTHKIVKHVVTYDSADGQVYELFNDAYVYYNDNYASASYPLSNMNYYIVPDVFNKLYGQQTLNWSLTASNWTEFTYDPISHTMNPTYTIETGPTSASMSDVENSTIRGLMDASISGKKLMGEGNICDAVFMSYDNAVEYLEGQVRIEPGTLVPFEGAGTRSTGDTQSVFIPFEETESSQNNQSIFVPFEEKGSVDDIQSNFGSMEEAVIPDDIPSVISSIIGHWIGPAAGGYCDIDESTITDYYYEGTDSDAVRITVYQYTVENSGSFYTITGTNIEDSYDQIILYYKKDTPGTLFWDLNIPSMCLTKTY